jgi:hypothetical protein
VNHSWDLPIGLRPGSEAKTLIMRLSLSFGDLVLAMQLIRTWWGAWLAAGLGLAVLLAVSGLIVRAAKGRRDELAKVRAEAPAGSPWSGWIESECLWAKPLGGDLYEIQNSPFHAPDLHFMDVVRAIPEAPGEIPRVVAVVRRGGHRTLRVMFEPLVADEDRHAMLHSLNRWRAYYESGDGRFFTIDIGPRGGYEAVIGQLDAWEKEGKLVYDHGTTHEGTS